MTNEYNKIIKQTKTKMKWRKIRIWNLHSLLTNSFTELFSLQHVEHSPLWDLIFLHWLTFSDILLFLVVTDFRRLYYLLPLDCLAKPWRTLNTPLWRPPSSYSFKITFTLTSSIITDDFWLLIILRLIIHFSSSSSSSSSSSPFMLAARHPRASWSSLCGV